MRSPTPGARLRAPDDLAARLGELGGAKAVFLTHSETSTGVVADLQALAAAAKPSGALVVVDGVSSLGAVPLETDAWGIDVLASGSQKALMTPPGLGLATVSPAAWAALGTSPRFYFDWEKTRAGQEKLDSAFTPAVSLVRALNVALGLLLDEGLEATFDRHVRLGRACREGAKAMGLELFSPDEDRSAVVTGILTPEGVDATELRLDAPRPVRRHGRRRPRRPEGPPLPHRSHRLLRRLRHRDRAGAVELALTEGGRGHRARRRCHARARSVRGARPECERTFRGPRPRADRRGRGRPPARALRRRRRAGRRPRRVDRRLRRDRDPLRRRS